MKQSYFIIFMFFSLTATALDYDFGKVSEEELEEKFNPSDSSASATYLYKYRKSYFQYFQNTGFQLITEVHERIKIYNQKGFDYATKKISLYKSGKDEEGFNRLKAYTYNLVNGKIEQEKLDKEGIFETERSKYYNEVKFTMPNIKEGCVVEYKYEIRSPFYSLVDEFQFQHDIPVKKIDAQFEAPEYFNFKVNIKGYLAIVPLVETKHDKIIFNNKIRTGVYVSTTTFSKDEIEFKKTIHSYNLSNIPALKEEPYVNNIDNYRASAKYELSYTNFPNSVLESYSATWEDVVKKIYESPNFGNELDKTGYFENDIDTLIGAVSDSKIRTALIFDFVKSKVKWDGYYGKYCDDGVRKAYKDQVGNVAEINLMLTAMLRYAGLKAYPVLVSTRHNGIPLFPTRDGYNYVVTCVKYDGEAVLLDATEKYSVPNVLPFRTLNWNGRVIAEKGNSELIDLYPKEPSKATILLMADLDENGALEGLIRNSLTGHSALSFREDYNENNKDDYLEKLENRYNGMEVSEFDVKNDLDLSKPIMETYRFVKESQADIIGDKIYFSPLFFLKASVNPFKLEKREFPVDFGYPSETNYRITINLPKGYKVERMPKPEGFMLSDNLGVFKYILSANEKNIQVVISSQINNSIISSQYYNELKLYFKQLIEKENEQIVLTKV